MEADMLLLSIFLMSFNIWHLILLNNNTIKNDTRHKNYKESDTEYARDINGNLHRTTPDWLMREIYLSEDID